MKRVLFVRSTPYNEDLDGYNIQGVGIAKAFCRAGYNCDYLNYSSNRNETIVLLDINGIQARVIYRSRIRVLRTGICLDALKKEFLSEYDVVICREYNQIMTHLIAKHHPNTSMYSGPYWNMFMIPIVSKIYDKLYSRKLNNELRCKFVKSQLAKDYLETKGYTDIIDVGVGLDTTRFEGVSCSESTLEIVDYMKHNGCLLYIGTIDANKNVLFILQMFTKLIEIYPDMKLLLIGKSKQSTKNKLLGRKDESYYKELLEQFPSKVRNKIMHIQRVENAQLQYIYPLAKAFILPSIHEIFGMVMLEAMYFGAPVITSLNGGSSTLIKNEMYGQIIREYDVAKWVAGISKYLSDQEYKETVVSNCKKMIREQYTWDYIIKRMMYHIKQKNEGDK